jgi:hypothetical protein
VALKVVGSSPTNHPKIKKFIKKIFKKKIFKKKIKNFLKIQNFLILHNNINISFLKNMNKKILTYTEFNFFYININQKKYNTKQTISTKNVINTFSVGSVIKYFNIKQGKSSRRSIKGTKIFLNFLKNVLEKKYNNSNFKKIYMVNSFDYNLLFLKKILFKLIQKGKCSTYLLFRLGIGFTKKKNPKKKSIKKRITKSILTNFINNNKQILFF